MKNLILILICFSFSFSAIGQALPKNDFRQIDKLGEVFNLIKYAYVDSPSESKLVEAAIVSMLEELDPHSVYIPPRNAERAEEQIRGNFEGVGIQFNIYKDTILVVNPIQGGPSEKLGIRASDRIIEINDSLVAGNGIKNSDVIRLLRGKKGTVVKVSIQRKGEKNLLDFDITRDEIPLNSVDASYMIDDKIGYIKINSFSGSTVEEFDKAVSQLKSEGMKDLILDLSNNGGGLLNAAIEISDRFLPKDDLIVYTLDRRNRKDQALATKAGNFEKGKVVVMINQESASASEIVSGAIQDHDRGTIVGRRSFGKGLVQRPFPLPDGSVIRLTIARYYTPAGRCIQKSYEEGAKAYHMEAYNRYASGELTSMDSIQYPDSLKFYTDAGRTVYGGGGITPDVFVPIDTTWYTDLFGKINRKGLFYSFAISYTDKYRDEFQAKYPKFEDYDKNYDKQNALSEFKEYIAKEEIVWNDSSIEKSMPVLETRLKAIIARNLFDSNAFYKIINNLGNEYQEAIKAIRRND